MLGPVYAEGDRHAFLWTNHHMDIDVERGSFWIFLLLLTPTSPGVWHTLDLVWWPLKMRETVLTYLEILAALILFSWVLLSLLSCPLYNDKMLGALSRPCNGN